MFSIPITDSPEQTGAVLRALAARDAGDDGHCAIDVAPWHALQTWLENCEHRIVIPYARKLADAVPPIAVRLRRDFSAVSRLIKAHAMLHQHQRGQMNRAASWRRSTTTPRSTSWSLTSWRPVSRQASRKPSVRQWRRSRRSRQNAPRACPRARSRLISA